MLGAGGTLMAQLRIVHTTTLNCDEIREKVGEVMGAVERRFDLKGHWDGDKYVFKRSGLDGVASIEDGKVSVTMELGFLLSALKGRIESEMKSKLSEKLP
jgi:putative polyhydroxyalkanoate system protein